MSVNKDPGIIPEDTIAGLAGALSMVYDSDNRAEVKQALEELILNICKEYHEYYSGKENNDHL